MKKFLAVLLASCLLLGGCGEQTEGEVTSTSPDKNKHMASEEPLELTVHFHYGTQIFDDEWPVYQKAEEYTNVKLKGTVSQMASDWNVSFNTMISTKPLPDIIWNSRERINQYALLGGFVPLDDLIEEHAPNIKQFFEEHPEMRKEMQASDGKLYMIPNFTEQRVKEIWYVRQDWMDKLNLETPTTVNELYNVAKAFREQDPNGNGQQDEVPIFGRAGYFQIKKLMNLYGVKMQNMQPFYEDNGQIVFSYMDDTFKEAIKNIHQWYAEGLIDQELYTRKDARTYLLSNNLGGISNDFHGSNDQMNDQYKDVIPGVHLDKDTTPIPR